MKIDSYQTIYRRWRELKTDKTQVEWDESDSTSFNMMQSADKSVDRNGTTHDHSNIICYNMRFAMRTSKVNKKLRWYTNKRFKHKLY